MDCWMDPRLFLMDCWMDPRLFCMDCWMDPKLFCMDCWMDPRLFCMDCWMDPRLFWMRFWLHPSLFCIYCTLMVASQAWMHSSLFCIYCWMHLMFFCFRYRNKNERLTSLMISYLSLFLIFGLSLSLRPLQLLLPAIIRAGHAIYFSAASTTNR